MRAVFLLALALIAQAMGAAPRVIAVNVDGVVHPITAVIVGNAIKEAREQHAELVLIRLNTPGGLSTAMRDTVSEIIASPVPVVTYVAPSGARAASAGFFLLEAGDVAAMAPGTATGAAHPVMMGTQMDSVMKQKVENDAAAYLRSIVTRRGRNTALAETAVTQSKSFTEREAVEHHLIDRTASNDQQLLQELNGRAITRFDGSTTTLHTSDAKIEDYQPSLRERIIATIADPNIALVLLVIGALGIYVEFASPGLILPGVLGAILVLLGLSGISLLPINWLGAALLLLAFVLFALEVKITSHGILGVAGAISMVLGAVLLIASPIPEMRVRWATAIGVALPFAAITIFLLSIALRARRNKVETGEQGLIGELGRAITDLAPAGKVFVHGEYWDAVAAKPVAAGATIKVTAVDRLQLTVEAV